MLYKLIHLFFEFQINIKLYHWTTVSYSRHRASDALYVSLSDNVDRMIEVLIGRVGRSTALNKKQKIEYVAMSDERIVTYLEEKRNMLELLKVDFEIASIRDDIVESINQALYLFSLR